MITPEDIAQWRGNPVTKRFREILETDRQTIMEKWATGAFRGDALLVMQGKAACLSDTIDAVHDIGTILAEAGEEVAV